MLRYAGIHDYLGETVDKVLLLVMKTKLEEHIDNAEATVVYTENCKQLEPAHFISLNLMMMIPGLGMTL